MPNSEDRCNSSFTPHLAYFILTGCTSCSPREGGTLLYKPYRYVPSHRVGCLRRFGLKTGIRFPHFGLESGMVFEGTTECMNVFIVKFQMSKKEREICEFEMDLKNFFVCALIYVQSTPDNSTLQGKSKKVLVIGTLAPEVPSQNTLYEINRAYGLIRLPRHGEKTG